MPLFLSLLGPCSSKTLPWQRSKSTVHTWGRHVAERDALASTLSDVAKRLTRSSDLAESPWFPVHRPGGQCLSRASGTKVSREPPIWLLIGLGIRLGFVAYQKRVGGGSSLIWQWVETRCEGRSLRCEVRSLLSAVAGPDFILHQSCKGSVPCSDQGSYAASEMNNERLRCQPSQ